MIASIGDPQLDPNYEPACPRCATKEAELAIKDAILSAAQDHGVPAAVVDDLLLTNAGASLVEMLGDEVMSRAQSEGGQLCYLCGERDATD